MGHQSDNADAIIAKIAERQLGLVTLRELLKEGVSKKAIRVRLARGSLMRCYPGVYSVGAPPTTTAAKYLATVLACGKSSRVSGLAAAWLLSLVSRAPPAPEITAPRLRRLDGVATHRSRLTGSRHTTLVDGVPTSRPAVALVECADRLEEVELSRAVHKALVKKVNEESFRAALADRPNSRGRARLEAVFRGDQPMVLSELERRFVELVGEAGLPLPVANRKLEGRFVDCRWPAHRLTVELLGFQFHNSRQAWEGDHARRREARARGDRFRTLTHDDVMVHSDATISEISELLEGNVA
ncbi:hypothetical protein HJD18_13670 [Thermoleophilia bacterium SCSIO 60948]|nr:hypothetical protein HJD18_13670 [Thermoleophilia bacterium SCSIO 60948]